jgi:hypothetical protein
MWYWLWSKIVVYLLFFCFPFWNQRAQISVCELMIMMHLYSLLNILCDDVWNHFCEPLCIAVKFWDAFVLCGIFLCCGKNNVRTGTQTQNLWLYCVVYCQWAIQVILLDVEVKTFYMLTSLFFHTSTTCFPKNWEDWDSNPAPLNRQTRHCHWATIVIL